jgi:hypothetical protein
VKREKFEKKKHHKHLGLHLGFSVCKPKIERKAAEKRKEKKTAGEDPGE